jgi:hypothetical protein
MSRSGYCEDGDYLDLYRASVDRAIDGKRGQAFLKDLASAMDAMPVKRLIANELENEVGEICAIGAVCRARGLDISKIDYEEPEKVGKAVGIARSMAAEIEYENDEGGPPAWQTGKRETPEERWMRMRRWVEENIKK